MSRVHPSLRTYIERNHILAETVNEGLEIRFGINIKIDIQKLGAFGFPLYGHVIFST